MNKISFSWNLTYKCNYRCPYCWSHGKWQDLDRYNRYPALESVIKSWKKIYNNYGSVLINILGGEPFIYPNFVELIKELSRMHKLNIQSNLSCNIDRFVKEVDPTNVSLGNTFHPLFADFDKYIEKAMLLKERGFGTKISYLAYPPQIKLMDYYKEKFTRNGLVFSVMTFWGKHNGKDYPASYTDEEKKLINLSLDDRMGEKYQIVPKKVKGRLCRAGQTYAVIYPEGTTIKCGSAALEDPKSCLKNFFAEDFELFKQPMPCDSDKCPCNEWAFLFVEDQVENKKQAKQIKKEREDSPIIIKSSPQEIEKRNSVPPYAVFFSWYLNNECNYNCSFCKPLDYKTADVKLEKWFAIWDSIYDRYGSCHLHISGGEPFIYPRFIELITYLSRKHTLEFSTNLFWNINPFLDNITPDRARLGGSFHPEFSDFDEFLNKILTLKERGFEVWVNYVAYPPHLKKMANFKKQVERNGIRFSIQPFNGKYEGRDYPLGYKPEEKALMSDSDQVNVETIDWRTDGEKSSIKGKLCRMGQMYARIYPDGQVSRCCGNGALKLGNILKGSFALLEQPMPCECESCPCHKCMLVEKEGHWPTYWTTPNRTNLKGHE